MSGCAYGCFGAEAIPIVLPAQRAILAPALTRRPWQELGRFMTGPYGCLVTRVLHFKHIYKEYVGVDACAADLIL